MGMTEPSRDVMKRGKIPHWMKNVDSTPELVMRYQMKTRDLQDALQADLRVLKEINQVSERFETSRFPSITFFSFYLSARHG